jgi:RES domain-containing protein
LSKDVTTAAAEYQQDSPLMPPGTMVAYQIELEGVVDLSDGYKAGEWEPIWEDWGCEWRMLAFNLRVEPPSWLMGDLAIAARARAILYPSTLVRGGVNLVIFSQTLTAQDKVEPFDPNGELPRNQDSWTAR